MAKGKKGNVGYREKLKLKRIHFHKFEKSQNNQKQLTIRY